MDNKTNLEEISIKIATATKSLIIANVYNPPDKEIDMDVYTTLFSHKNSIICGDFNAHNTLWGSTAYFNERGRILEALIEEKNFVCLNTGAGTFITHAGNYTCIDLTFCTNNLAAACNWEVLGDSLGSDHLPVLIKMNEEVSREDRGQPRWVYKRADWETFRNDCRERLTDELESDDIATFASNITETIISVARKNIPETTPMLHARVVPYWNKECNRAVKGRNRARIHFRNTRDLDDNIEYKRLKGVAQRTIKIAAKEYWEEYCDSLDSATKLGGVWRMSKRMSGVKSNACIPTISQDGKTYQTNEDNANIMAENFAKASSNANYDDVFKRRKKDFENENREELYSNNNGNIGAEGNILNESFEHHELAAAIRQSKKHSSPGNDKISYEILKQIPKPCQNIILKFFNLVWNKGTLPADWKHSIVIPILKINKLKSDPQSYRPISLTSALCKIMERLIANRLSWFMEKNNLFNKYQTGFRKGRSTIDQIMRLQDDIHKNIRNGGVYCWNFH